VGARDSTRSPVSVLAAALVPGYGSGHTKDGRARSLTPRERDVLTLVARGLAGKQVARHLGISPKTVEQHKTRIFAKLGVPNQAAAVYALGSGMEGSELWT
jgi:DNA-binding NarL/FixJ family response regulator